MCVLSHPYPSDLSNQEWEVLAPLIPPAKPGGRRRKWPMQRILNAVFYVLRSGCQWRLHFPTTSLHGRLYITTTSGCGAWTAPGSASTRCCAKGFACAEVAILNRALAPRQPIGKDHQHRRRARLRRSQETQRKKAAFAGGYARFG